MHHVDRYCVFGNPVAHSKSPEIHAAFAAQTGQRILYERRLAEPDGFADAVRAFIHEGGMGANVTVPFKLDACALADALSARAQAAGAVNTLTFRGGVILGDNTDGAGLVADIVSNAGWPVKGKRVLLLGAGGAARGVILPLLGQQPSQIMIANRTRATADALVAQFSSQCGDPEQLKACDFSEPGAPFDIIINATSASLNGAVVPLPAAVFGPRTLALDMMYGKQPTAFMEYAQRHGASVRDGLGMLVEQAAEAFFVWRGVRPDTRSLLADMRAQP
ncbi:MAG: shikimate dehydrogenase [Janthinobacterium sp.]|jgi:shikimate dehydrogenase